MTIAIPTNYRECYLPNRAFGLELETSVEVRCPSGWTWEYDGSVNGKEYHSGPVLGQDGIDKVTEGCIRITEAHSTEPVDRDCGYHIHLNARDLNEEQVSRFMRFAYHYQPYYFMLVRGRRFNNSYTGWLPAACKDLDNVEAYLYSTPNQRRHATESKHHATRCNWVNCHSYFYRGSIEIRLHHGVTKPHKVLNWAEVMLKSLEFGIKSDWESDKPYFWDMLALAGVRQKTIEYYKQRSLDYHGDFECVSLVNNRMVLVERNANAVS